MSTITFNTIHTMDYNNCYEGSILFMPLEVVVGGKWFEELAVALMFLDHLYHVIESCMLCDTYVSCCTHLSQRIHVKSFSQSSKLNLTSKEWCQSLARATFIDIWKCSSVVSVFKMSNLFTNPVESLTLLRFFIKQSPYYLSVSDGCRLLVRCVCLWFFLHL